MKILIVEDEYAIRSFITLNFKREGALGFKNEAFEVFEADSGEEAIRIFEENEDIRLVLLDVMLPGIDGFEVLRYLREKSDEIGIIMLTARTHEQDKVMGLEYGADDYISKPFSPAELQEQLFHREDFRRRSDIRILLASAGKKRSAFHGGQKGGKKPA